MNPGALKFLPAIERVVVSQFFMRYVIVSVVVLAFILVMNKQATN